MACCAAVALVAIPTRAATSPIASYQLLESDFQTLEAPDKIWKILDSRLQEEFPDTTTLLKTLQDDLKDYPETFARISNILRIDVDPPSELVDSLFDPLKGFPVLKIWLDSASLDMLKSQLLSKAKQHPLPAPMIAVAREVQGADFPEESLLHDAIKSKLAAGYGTCRLPPGTTPLHDTDIQRIHSELDEFYRLGSDSDHRVRDAFEGIVRYRHHEGGCAPAALDSVVHWDAIVYDSLLRSIVHSLSRKRHPFPPRHAPRWKSGSCGCSQENLNGLVVGFHPYWQNDSTRQNLDLSLLSRIEYFALPLDDGGHIPTGNAHDPSTGFLRTARAYDAKVDWVVSRGEWGTWTSDSVRMKAMLSLLPVEISNFLNNRLIDLPSRVEGWSSFPGKTPFTWGDGVTIYFPGYPTDPASLALFQTFYRRLDSTLKIRDKDLFANILVSQTDLERDSGIASFANLLGMLTTRDSSWREESLDEESMKSRLHALILVLVNPPTRTSLPFLLHSLDSAFTPAERKLFLHSLVPVLSSNPIDSESLRSDLTFAGDTYYGIGFWPADPNSAPDSAAPPNDAIRTRLLKELFTQKNSNSNWFPWICPHRWIFRIALGLGLAALVAFAAAAMAICTVRHKLGKLLFPSIAALALVPIASFLALLYFDPGLAEMRAGNTPLICLSVVFVLVITAMGLYVTSKKPLPSREALREEMRKLGGKG